MAFETDNVTAHVDFDERRGDFKAIDGATLIDLPAIRYQCMMDEFSWFMDEERLDLFNTLIDPAAMTFQELADRDQAISSPNTPTKMDCTFSAQGPPTKSMRDLSIAKGSSPSPLQMLKSSQTKV